MKNQICKLLVALAAAGTLCAFNASAQVQNLEDFDPSDPLQWVPGSLRWAILWANPGDTITFDPGVTGTIKLSGGALVIDKDITIQGPGYRLLSLDGNGSDRVFDVAGSWGGGATLTVVGLMISGGVAGGTSSSQDGIFGAVGGGIYVGSDCGLIMTNCWVVGNRAIGLDGTQDYPLGWINAAGGAICSDGDVLVLDGCSIIGNTAIGGNNAYAGGGTAYGGGIYASGSALLSNCTIDANTAQGGNSTWEGAPDTAYSNPPAYGGGGEGGGLCAAGTTLLNNCTVFNNEAAGGQGMFSAGSAESGGISAYGGDVTLNHCTITGNGCSSSGPGMYVSLLGGGLNQFGPGSFTLGNTIVAGNWFDPYDGNYADAGDVDLGGQGPKFLISGDPWTSVGYNLIGQVSTNSNFGFGPTDKVGTTNQPIDPMLGPIQDNGGPTLTMLPKGNSPAIDAGTADGLSTDQRGFPRPVLFTGAPRAQGGGGDGSDIGSVEVSAPATLSIGNPSSGWWRDQAVITWESEPGYHWQLLESSTPNGSSAANSSAMGWVPSGASIITSNRFSSAIVNMDSPTGNKFFRLVLVP
jgi:hypothetical protein